MLQLFTWQSLGGLRILLQTGQQKVSAPGSSSQKEMWVQCLTRKCPFLFPSQHAASLWSFIMVSSLCPMAHHKQSIGHILDSTHVVSDTFLFMQQLALPFIQIFQITIQSNTWRNLYNSSLLFFPPSPPPHFYPFRFYGFKLDIQPRKSWERKGLSQIAFPNHLHFLENWLTLYGVQSARLQVKKSFKAMVFHTQMCETTWRTSKKLPDSLPTAGEDLSALAFDPIQLAVRDVDSFSLCL